MCVVDVDVEAVVTECVVDVTAGVTGSVVVSVTVSMVPESVVSARFQGLDSSGHQLCNRYFCVDVSSAGYITREPCSGLSSCFIERASIK